MIHIGIRGYNGVLLDIYIMRRRKKMNNWFGVLGDMVERLRRDRQVLVSH